MPLTKDMPQYGCEHLDQDITTKIQKLRLSRAKELDEGLAVYVCLKCPTGGNLLSMEKHVSKTNHDFALGKQSVYCGQCKDLVYEPSFSPVNLKKRKLSDFTEEDEASFAADTLPKPCGREGVRGLFNLGETCYMNAVLQMMVHNRVLSSYFLGSGHQIHTCPISKEPEKKLEEDSSSDEDGEPKPEHKMCFACSMTGLFADSSMAELSIPAHAVDVLYASWKAMPTMSGKGQQDAQEWFIMMVDKLHETIKPSLDKKGQCRCFFHKVFFGNLSSEVTCDTCSTVSSTQEPYSSISLDFKKQVKKRKKSALPDIKTAVPNILECLKSYTTPEILSPDAYNCHGCGVPRSASKRLRIKKLPAILCVHVKRFGMKIINNIAMEEKYMGKIDYPLQLNMAPFTTNPDAKDKEKFAYDLETVVVHQGEHIQNGHYFAFCRQDGKWFRFDDEIVSATTTEDVLRQEAYLLFYSLRSMREMGMGKS